MNTTTQIKNNLISRIKESTDLSFLKALQTFFDSAEEELYQLSSEQESSILKGREQLKNGQFSSNEEVVSELEHWLRK